MITFSTSRTIEELSGILRLQKCNLPDNLSKSEKQSQGFVTVSHSLNDLKKLNEIEPHVIIMEGDEVIGYLLAMTKSSRNDIPVLIPMFNTFDKIGYKSKLISGYNYIVVGQVCIAKDHRGKGLLDKCYDYYRTCFIDKYDFAITEIASTNIRSINAHKRIGFEEIHRYTDEKNTQWSIVIWDWNKN